ncbi:MAG: DNA phosphorothioation-dependent restriction protein DptH [Gammaproteobacteria bacterium]|nr:DNA phosphorothioation-dependent restriction protein DptH [Gammaproteobacteria bacterium]
MSGRPFEDFIVDHFHKHAKGQIFAGYKYQFRSPNSKNSHKLFHAFVKKGKQIGFIDVSGSKLAYFEVNEVKLIPIIHKEDNGIGYTENFISYLRDEVSAQNGPFLNTALLILHNSMLDTLINSSHDITVKGGIFDPESIKNSLYEYIDSSDSIDGKDISKILLDYQYDQIIDDKSSMFGFQALHDAICDGDIRFTEIALLEDPSVLNMKGQSQQVKSRLDQNKALYDKIEQVVQHYPDQLEDHLADLSSEFIQKHFLIDENVDSWKKVTFDEFLKEQERNRVQELSIVNEQSASARLVIRSKGESKSAQRERHIIIEVDAGRSDFDLRINLVGAKVQRDEIRLEIPTKTNDRYEISIAGGSKNTNITITGSIESEPKFFGLSLKRNKASECFKYRCLVVRKSWFNIDSIENIFLVNHKKKSITLQTPDTDIYVGLIDNSNKRTPLESIDQCFDVTDVGWIDFESLSNEVEQISFAIHNGTVKLAFYVEGAAATDYLTLPLIFDTDLGTKLFQNLLFGVFNQSKERVYLENKEVKANKQQMDMLKRESDWLDNDFVSVVNDDALSISDIERIAPNLGAAYAALYSYLRTENSLPSLSGWGSGYINVVTDVVEEYIQFLNAIQIDEFLESDQIKIVQIGILRTSDEEWITPFHPLVLAYYLELVQRAVSDSDESYLNLPKVTLARLTPQGLLPYIYNEDHDFSYVQAFEESSFWLRCVPQQKSDYGYIRKLVREKIREFTEAFKSLFPEPEADARPTLTINSVNNYDNHGIFEGIVDHLTHVGSKTFNIHVNLYDDAFQETEFDRFSEIASYESIKQRYGLNKGKNKDDADSIVDLLRTRVSYSKFIHSRVNEQAYAHLSFFRNNQKIEVIDVDPDERLSGICAHGLVNGEASSNDKGNYITGFGTKNVKLEDNRALNLAKLYGRLVKPARKSAFTYRKNSAIALAVNDRFKDLLERCYQSSIWTSIIDPKVTLDFFNSTKDLLLIHYSDQYTSSATYDAITVTRQTALYHKVLEKEDGGLVTEFNAFNGEWLLKLITDNEKIRKERKGILAAYKLISILLARSNITWVPMSAAEMVRVSGNIGLNMTESEFSRHVQGYRNGAISDDVLFVGFREPELFLLPLEVKTGHSYDPIKAITQAKELGRYLAEILGSNNLAGSIYRGLFVRQALIQVDKYLLYNVYPEDYFQSLLKRKEWWLQGDYRIAIIDDYPEGFVVANLESGQCMSTSAELVNNILKLEVPSSFMKKTISTPLRQFLNDPSGTAAAAIDERFFLPCNPATISATLDHEIYFDQVKQSEEPEPEKEQISELGTSSKDEIEPIVPLVKSEDEFLKILIGHDVNHKSPVYWEPTNTAKFMNTNSGIIGTMGTGKTQCTKSVVTQLYRSQHLNVDGKPIGMLIFDYKSDYVDDKFQSATNAKKYNLYKLPYNPLSLFGDTPMLPVHTARGFSETMGKAFGLGQKQQLRLRKLIGEAYELAGIDKSDKNTWFKPAPTISDVWTLFIHQEKVEEDSLYAALESLNELKIFEDDVGKCTSLYELIDGIRVIELAGYPPEIQNLVVALTLDLFYSQMQKQGKPEIRGDYRQITKLILVDEADNFMSQDFPSLRRILKEGREYGVGVILSTQDITHFKTKENDYSAYILSWVVHRVSQIKNQDIKALFNKDEKSEQEYLMKTIRELDKHFSLYVDGDKLITKIRDTAFWEL